MNEFELIRQYFQFPSRAPGTHLGVGDDAAVIGLETEERLVVTVDTLVESVHFPENADARSIAARCLRTNLSDLAAMGAEPRWFTLALTLPEVDQNWLRQFSEGLNQEADLWQIDLVGGDTTRGQLTISIQMMGVVQDRWLTRSGARVGDAVLVTGSLGDAAGFLATTEDHQMSQQDKDYLSQRFWMPEPRLSFARQAIQKLTAACDISDGLLADLGHICRASNLGAEIQVSDLPLSDAQRIFSPAVSRDLALMGGDDYELCVTASPDDVQQLIRMAESSGHRLTQIGTLVEGSEINCFDEAGPFKPTGSGYLHFS